MAIHFCWLSVLEPWRSRKPENKTQMDTPGLYLPCTLSVEETRTGCQVLPLQNQFEATGRFKSSFGYLSTPFWRNFGPGSRQKISNIPSLTTKAGTPCRSHLTFTGDGWTVAESQFTVYDRLFRCLPPEDRRRLLGKGDLQIDHTQSDRGFIAACPGTGFGANG